MTPKANDTRQPSGQSAGSRRRISILSAFAWIVIAPFLTNCNQAPSPPSRQDAWLSFKFTSGFGGPGCGLPPGTCGLDDEVEAGKYYSAIGADTLVAPPNGSVFDAWKTKYGFVAGATIAHASYGNQADLQLGRDMYCVQVPPQVACYVSNYGQPPFDAMHGVENSQWPDLAGAVSQAVNHASFVPFATVAMVSNPNGVGPNGDKVTFYVFDGTGTLINFAALDGEGKKSVPRMCMACHGGSYAPSTASTPASATGAFFLPFDTGSFKYDPSLTEDQQQEAFRQLNTAVLAAANPSPAIVEFINGSYCSSAGNPTISDPTSPSCRNQVGNAGSTTFDGFVPAGWNGQFNLYNGVVKKYCRMCHLAGAPAFNSYQDFVGTATTIEDFVCGKGDMPHAEVPFGSGTNANLTHNAVGFWLDNLGTAEKDLKAFLSSQMIASKCP